MIAPRQRRRLVLSAVHPSPQRRSVPCAELPAFEAADTIRHDARRHPAGRAVTRVMDEALSERRVMSDEAEAESTTVYDLRVVVESIEGRSVCGLQVGDFFELRNSSEIHLRPGRHFCLYALNSVIPLLPAKQRTLPDGDWIERDSRVTCPDPEERLVMRIERIRRVTIPTDHLT